MDSGLNSHFYNCISNRVYSYGNDLYWHGYDGFPGENISGMLQDLITLTFFQFDTRKKITTGCVADQSHSPTLHLMITSFTATVHNAYKLEPSRLSSTVFKKNRKPG